MTILRTLLISAPKSVAHPVPGLMAVVNGLTSLFAKACAAVKATEATPKTEVPYF
jgi:hypothetical protein